MRIRARGEVAAELDFLTHSGPAGGVATSVCKATGTKSAGGLRLERAGEGRHSMPEIWGRFLGPGVGSAAGGRRAGVQPALPAARRQAHPVYQGSLRAGDVQAEAPPGGGAGADAGQEPANDQLNDPDAADGRRVLRAGRERGPRRICGRPRTLQPGAAGDAAQVGTDPEAAGGVSDVGKEGDCRGEARVEPAASGRPRR